MSDTKSTNKLTLSILQRYKITDIIHGLKDGTPGQIIAGGRICQIIEFTPDEVEKFQFQAVYKDTDSKEIVGHKWNNEGNQHLVEFTFNDHQIIHLKKFILTNPYVQMVDFVWMDDLFNQLGIDDDEMQKF